MPTVRAHERVRDPAQLPPRFLRILATVIVPPTNTTAILASALVRRLDRVESCSGTRARADPADGDGNGARHRGPRRIGYASSTGSSCFMVLACVALPRYHRPQHDGRPDRDVLPATWQPHLLESRCGSDPLDEDRCAAPATRVSTRVALASPEAPAGRGTAAGRRLPPRFLISSGRRRAARSSP